MADHPRGSAVFAGCARSCAAHLDAVLANLDAFASAYEKSAIVIFENDSEDDTAERLLRYAAGRPNVSVMSHPGLASTVKSRTKRLAIARNAYLDFIRESEFRGYDHLVVLDFDEVNAGSADLGGFHAARRWLDDHPELNGLFANSQPIYYDLWALRHAAWSAGDCWSYVRESGGGPDAYAQFVYSRMVPIPPQTPPIKVGSAFGGLGLYRMDRALQGVYADRSTDSAGQCEHVQFHAEIIEKAGGEFAIFPPLTNRTGWAHVLSEFG
ncbi:MAG TPA: hypothetical protein VJP88_04305, partial [Caulobacteraceae bacterium]|nr:hypothetical protein [Caulobacteraceae bacterium]